MEERFIPESQLKEAVREILADMLGLPAAPPIPQPASRQWFSASDAYQKLSLDSAEQLRELQRSGLLRLGVEVRDIRAPESLKPYYQFHIAKCEQRLLEAPARRCSKKKIQAA